MASLPILRPLVAKTLDKLANILSVPLKINKKSKTQISIQQLKKQSKESLDADSDNKTLVTHGSSMMLAEHQESH